MGDLFSSLIDPPVISVCAIVLYSNQVVTAHRFFPDIMLFYAFWEIQYFTICCKDRGMSYITFHLMHASPLSIPLSLTFYKPQQKFEIMNALWTEVLALTGTLSSPTSTPLPTHSRKDYYHTNESNSDIFVKDQGSLHLPKTFMYVYLGHNFSLRFG